MNRIDHFELIMFKCSSKCDLKQKKTWKLLEPICQCCWESCLLAEWMQMESKAHVDKDAAGCTGAKRRYGKLSDVQNEMEMCCVCSWHLWPGLRALSNIIVLNTARHNVITGRPCLVSMELSGFEYSGPGRQRSTMLLSEMERKLI